MVFLSLKSFGISWAFPSKVIDLFGKNWLEKYLSDIWNLISLCLTWCLWRERHSLAFEDVESSDDQLLASFVGTLFDWYWVWGLILGESVPMFVDSLLSCI